MRRAEHAITVHAPAKVNLSLEVLGRRADGYHELRTVFQAAGLFDALTVEDAPGLSLTVEGDAPGSGDNLVLRAARALIERTPEGGERGAHIHLRKNIPAGAGLGGGSSDAAATLLVLNRMWDCALNREQLAEPARELGADVPFFLYGGAALGAGRGDVLTPLRTPSQLWLVLAVPPFSLPGKTARMFGRLTRDEYTDGSRTLALASDLERGVPITTEQLYNGLFPAALREFDDLAGYVAGLRRVSTLDWMLSGAGPACFTLAGAREEAEEIAGLARRLPGTCHVVPALEPLSSYDLWPPPPPSPA